MRSSEYLPAGVQAKVVETKAGRVEYADAGEGPVVLAVHGTGGGWDQNMIYFDFLLDADFRLVSPSRPGYLRTPLTTGPAPEQQADSYAALLDAIGFSSVAVVADSGGGPSAYAFAMRHPSRCSALVAIDAVCGPYTMPPLSKMEEKLFLTVPGEMIVGWLFRLFPETMAREFLKKEGRLTPEEVRAGAKNIVTDPKRKRLLLGLMGQMSQFAGRKAGVENDLAQMRRLSWMPLSQVQCPALLIHGKADADVPFAHAEHAARTIPEVEHFWIERGFHFGALFSEQALEAQDWIRLFLRRHALSR